MPLSRFKLISILMIALAGAAHADEPARMGVEINGERLAVIDMHLHTGTWNTKSLRFQQRLLGRIPDERKPVMIRNMDQSQTGQGILATLDEAGISAGAVFAVWSPATTGIATNEFAAEQVAVNPDRLFGFASFRADRWNRDGPERLRRMEEAIEKHGMVGIKVAHAHQQFRLDDERFEGVYEIAQRQGTPIYLHTGTSPNPGTRTEPPYCDPAYLEGAIRRYPDVIFILGHSGYDSFNRALTYTDSAIDLAQRYSNVYLEPGALGARRAAGVLQDYLERIRAGGVVEKLLYGSDGPQFAGYVKSHLDAFVTGMHTAGYTTDEMRLILADNFTRVFGMPKISLENPQQTTE